MIFFHFSQKRKAPLFITGLLCALPFVTNAQVWNKTYIEDRPAMIFSSIIQTDSTYNIVGATYGFSNQYGKGFTGQISTDGVLLDYHIFIDSSYDTYGVYSNTLIGISDSQLAFTGNSYDTVPYLMLGMVNTQNGAIEIFKYYTANTYSFVGHCMVNKNSSKYIAGVRTDGLTNNANVVLIKIDASGNRIWEKYYDQHKLDLAKSIIQLINGNLMLGAVRNDVNQTNEKANTWLLEVDTGGNVVRQWFDPNDSTYVAEGLRQTQDGGFIYGAQKKYLQTINSVYKVATIVKTDNNFNKQWVFTDGSYNTETAIVDLEELPDGSFIGCGNKPFYYTDSSVVSGWVVKLNSNGQVIWNRIYRSVIGSQTLNLLTDIDVLPDGGFIAVGQCQQSGATPPQVGWFLKLDSNGCEVENCILNIDDRQQTQDIRQIQVYPTLQIVTCKYKRRME